MCANYSVEDDIALLRNDGQTAEACDSIVGPTHSRTGNWLAWKLAAFATPDGPYILVS